MVRSRRIIIARGCNSTPFTQTIQTSRTSVFFLYSFFFTTRGRHSNLKGCRKIKGYRLIFNFFFLTIIIFHTIPNNSHGFSSISRLRPVGVGRRRNEWPQQYVYFASRRYVHVRVRSIYINYLSVNASNDTLVSFLFFHLFCFYRLIYRRTILYQETRLRTDLYTHTCIYIYI